MKSTWLYCLVISTLAFSAFGAPKTWRENSVVTVFRESVGLGLNKLFRRAENYFDRKEDVALAEAVAGGKPYKIGKCIEVGGNVNAVGREGFTPLLWAIMKSSKEGFIYLLQQGADPNLITTRYDGDQMSIMEEIATFRKTDYLRLALENGASPDAPSSGGKTILFRAITFSNLENVKALVEAGSNINHQDKGGRTPVLLAADMGKYSMVYYLLNNGADPLLETLSGYDLIRSIKLFGFTEEQSDYQYYLKVLEKLGIQENEVWKPGQPRDKFIIQQKFENGVWVGHE